MVGIKFSVHPLFFLLGFYYALTGRIFTFIIFTLSAVIHELGHSFSASSMGYRLDKIVLMPFGAVIKGQISGLNALDQIKIALSGPLINLLVAVIFVAIWWVKPQTYAYTDILVTSNLSLALINLIPAYPLDGGRVVMAVLKNKMGEKRAVNLCKVLGLLFALALFALFVYSIFTVFNLSLLLFSVFVLVGAFSNKVQSKYVRLYTGLDEKQLRRGVEIKRQAVSCDISVKRMLSILDENRLNELVVYINGKKSVVLNQSQINQIIEEGQLYQRLENYL